MKTTRRAAKLNSSQIESARLAAESGAEMGADWALYADLNEEDTDATIRAEAMSRVAGTTMPEHEWKAYVRAFVAAACEALGV